MPSGPGASKIWRESYAQAKRQGYRNFKKGTPGYDYVRRVAEKIAGQAGK